MGAPEVSWSYSVTFENAGAGTNDTASTVSLDDVIPTDLAIDYATGDLADPPYIVRGADAVAQRLWFRTSIWIGEWFLNLRVGIPYVQSILVAAPDIRLIRSLYLRAYMGCPGVRSIENFNPRFDRPTRQLFIEGFRVRLIDTSILDFDHEALKSKPLIVV